MVTTNGRMYSETIPCITSIAKRAFQLSNRTQINKRLYLNIRLKCDKFCKKKKRAKVVRRSGGDIIYDGGGGGGEALKIRILLSQLTRRLVAAQFNRIYP